MARFRYLHALAYGCKACSVQTKCSANTVDAETLGLTHLVRTRERCCCPPTQSSKIVVAADYAQYKNLGCSQEAAPSAACGCIHLQVCYAPKRHGKLSERRKPCWQKTVLAGTFLQVMGIEDAGHGIYKWAGWLTSKKNLGGRTSRRAFPFYRRGVHAFQDAAGEMIIIIN